MLKTMKWLVPAVAATALLAACSGHESGGAAAAPDQAATQAPGATGKAAGEAFLAATAKKPGVKVTNSGLEYEVLREGNGPHPQATDSVTVNYRGTLINGSEFDSSYRRGEPATFPLDHVIPGWTEGVQLMTVGSKYRFYIPYYLAYGDGGAGATIGPDEALIFDVELISINK